MFEVGVEKKRKFTYIIHIIFTMSFAVVLANLRELILSICGLMLHPRSEEDE